MKKLICLALIVGLLFSLAGCASSGNAPGGVGSSTSGQEPILKEPPTLEFSDDESTANAMGGGYSWSYDNGDGTWTSMIADGLHPLDCGGYMVLFTACSDTLKLTFAREPESFTVCCWPDSALGDWENATEQPVTTDGGTIPLNQGGYVYQVTAQFDAPNFRGTAYYCFHVLWESHTHSAAQEPCTVDNPVTGFCGNTQTIVTLDGKEHTLIADDSVALTAILINLSYSPELLCRCDPELSITTEDGTMYSVNLCEAFARCDSGQAPLTAEQVAAIRDVLQRLE